MTRLKYNNKVFDVSAGHSVLDILLENGQAIPNSCRAGACQSCLMQVTKGNVPEKAQKGLKESHKAKGLFLACSCQPEEDIEICLPDSEKIKVSATITKVDKLSSDVLELSVEPKEYLDFIPGQYVTLWLDEKLGRSYSLANIPKENGELTFHIRLVPNGLFSGWIHSESKPGDTI